MNAQVNMGIDTMAHEVWRDVIGYEGLYQVSDQGRVRSLDRMVPCSKGERVHKGKLLSLSSETPYRSVSLSKHNVQRSVRVHRLVAETFVPNPSNLPCVDHKNCDKTDNRAVNLRWCTPKQNTAYAAKNGLMIDLRPFSQWTKEQQERFRKKRVKPIIRDDGKRYPSCKAAADDAGVTYGAVMHVLRGLTSSCKGHSYRYDIREV